ncbi:MAG TPA: hypothetical protein VGK67_14240 [Myxococcales bacterium]|jgi:hypothetical protein
MSHLRISLTLALALSAALSTGCGGGNAPSGDAGCTPGSLGCTCNQDLRCGTSASGKALTCEAGVCIEPACRPGTEGCPCGVNSRCGLGSTGKVLTCQAGTCVADTCPAGSTGCSCQAGACSVVGDVCRDGFCQAANCVPGELHCSCLGGSCSSASLVCVEGALCADATGRLGGPCLSDGTCNSGLRCDQASCTPCALGSLGCTCDATGGCAAGLACNTRRTCAVPGEGVAPVSPVCYTPCQSGLEDPDGGFRPCTADGLMAGCLGGRTCREGSCLLDGESAKGCVADVDCPDFQTCIEGRCYSTCEHDGQCQGSKRCYLHVCREPCAASSPGACDRAQYCGTLDGENGYCLPLRGSTGVAQRQMTVSFAVSKAVIDLSNIQTSATFQVTNHSDSSRKFTVRKRSHLRALADGTSESLDDPLSQGTDAGAGCDPATNCPLTWLYLGPEGAPVQAQSVVVGIDAHQTATFAVGHAGDNAATRWQGQLEVIAEGGGAEAVRLSYAERPEGQWQGTLYYFANFGDGNLAAWRASQTTRDNITLVNAVGNAFVQRWAAFRLGRISWDELQAALVATRSESWRWPSVKSACAGGGQAACYPYLSNKIGVVLYSSDITTYPIPTGVTEFPMAMNLRMPDPVGSPNVLEGRIESSYAMQYAGNPAVKVQFATSPSACGRQAFGACVTFLDKIESDIVLGGRYQTDADDADCQGAPADTFTHAKTPWLLPGFQRATELDSSTGVRYRHECRGNQLPFASADPAQMATLLAGNALMSQANPIPDGRSRKRSLRLVDGALINQSQMLILFEERFDSFLSTGDTDGFKAYGYMLLERARVDLDTADANQNGVPDAFDGSHPVQPAVEPAGLLEVHCSDAVVQPLVANLPSHALDASTAAEVARGLITGSAPSSTPTPLTPASAEQVHYLCEDSGLFDGGPQNTTPSGTTASVPNDDSCAGRAKNFVCEDGGPASKAKLCLLGTDQTDCGPRQDADVDARLACPATSKVTFFTVDVAQLANAAVVGHACQQQGTCGAQLASWRGTQKLVQYEPLWRCADEQEVFCDDDRLDLRHGKVFFAQTSQSPAYLPIQAEIELAFRYRTRFVSRSDTTVGFAPTTCIPDSNLVPYCYDPAAIETLRERTDCLLYIWKTYPMDDKPEVRTQVDNYLKTGFSYQEEIRPDNTRVIHDGYERLNAELMIMMGDESYTAAFASRFDLSGSRASSFQGSLFEPGGVDLAGVLGYELYTLYRATQYYQEVLDRFYALSPLVWDSLNGSRNFVQLETVVRYFDKLVRASTQKSRASSEIARRYQALNRPDLARRVIERAYTASYLESVVMSRMMVDVLGTIDPQQKAQLLLSIEDAQLRYRVAGADMRKVYGNITDRLTSFGLAADYVPLPALDANQPNAFELVIARALDRAKIARDREDLALNSNRSYETDSAQFQSELARIRQTYENQLGNLCGTFIGTDGRVYAATEKYAALNDRASLLGNPCGLMGNGQIHEAMGQFELMQLELQSVVTSSQNVQAEIAIERGRAHEQCEQIDALADYVYDAQGAVLGLNAAIGVSKNIISSCDRVLQRAQVTAELAKCSVIAGLAVGGDCPMAAVATAIYSAISTPVTIAEGAAELAITGMEASIAAIDRESGRWQTEHQCDVIQIDSLARVMSLLLRLKELDVEMLKAQRKIELAVSELQQQQHESVRLQAEQKEAEQLAINVEAARNDPNVRIYKNDAIINADFAFDDAMREAYRATKVFEYYTSQSYAGREQLYLIRMVARGDYNLENYLLDLQNEFTTFEETYGNPDTRVQIVSLRDDILNVARLDAAGRPLDQAARIDLLRQKLGATTSLDENGYLTFPFNTSLDALSPLTRNHKLLYVEAEIIGSDVGDTLGRLYLRQQGTGVVRGVSGEKDYYRLPERTAVVNPFFNGQRVYGPDVYRTYRLRDRPYSNTSWELVLNQRDEQVNKDIDLNSLTDVRVYLYYTDFTTL